MDVFADIYNVLLIKDNIVVKETLVHVYFGLLDVAVDRISKELSVEYDRYESSYQYTES